MVNYKHLEELGALLKDKKTLLEIYSLATSQPYSFLYVNLMSKQNNNTFYINFDKNIEIE